MTTRCARVPSDVLSCVSRSLRGAEACPRGPVNAPAIEGYVVEQLRAATEGGGLAREIGERARVRLDRTRAPLDVERAALPGEIDALRLEARRLAGAVSGASGDAVHAFRPKLEEVGARLAAAERRLGEVERAIALLEADEIEAGWVERSLADFAKVWSVLLPEGRGRLLRAVLERVAIDERGKVVVALWSGGPLGEESGGGVCEGVGYAGEGAGRVGEGSGRDCKETGEEAEAASGDGREPAKSGESGPGHEAKSDESVESGEPNSGAELRP